MKIALETGLFSSYTIEKTLEEMSRIGYKFVELSHPDFNPIEATDEQIKHLKELLEEYDIEPASVLAIYGIASPDESVRKASVEKYKQTIRTTNALGCSMITPEMDGDPKKREACTESFKRSIDELCPYLLEEDVKISFEPHPGDFIEKSNDAVDLIREIGCENVGYTYCSCHTFVMCEEGQDATSMIEYAGDTLFWVYATDTHKPMRIIHPPTDYGVHEHLIPGRGDVDFEELFFALKKIGYDGFVSSNCFGYSDIPVKAAEETKRKLDELIKEVEK